MVPLADAISIGGRASLGIYANRATLDRSYSADNDQSPFATDAVSATSTATGFAASVETSPRVELAVTESIDVSLGATVLYLNGVDEPGTHFAGIGAPGGGGGLASDSPSLTNTVHFAGVTVGLHGTF